MVHHSNRGVQYLSIAYTRRLAEAVNALYKAELIYRAGPWRTIEDVEPATLSWVDWYNHRRLHGHCRNTPPAEYEDLYHQQYDPAGTHQPGELSLH